MKIYIVVIACLYRTLAITVHYETSASLSKSSKDYKSSLKDIRLVPLNEAKSRQEPSVLTGDQSEIFTSSKSPGQQQMKSRGIKNKLSARMALSNYQDDANHQKYMKKMADQLYTAQKHASLLSDYQKFIINQDPHVKSFVLGQTHQVRNPKPFSQPKQKGKSLPVQANRVKEATMEPETVTSSTLKRIVVVTPKIQKFTQSDHSAQPTDVEYVSIVPQKLSRFVETHESPKGVTLLSYTPRPYTYYGSEITQKPQIETVQAPTTLAIGLGPVAYPQYSQEESLNPETHHDKVSKYEFMYKIKDHEKNSNFGHMESRTDKGTYGYYYVHLPDGRLETVKYWADRTGYHAKVDYEGEAKHPKSSEYKLHSHHNLGFH